MSLFSIFLKFIAIATTIKILDIIGTNIIWLLVASITLLAFLEFIEFVDNVDEP